MARRVIEGSLWLITRRGRRPVEGQQRAEGNLTGTAVEAWVEKEALRWAATSLVNTCRRISSWLGTTQEEIGSERERDFISR